MKTQHDIPTPSSVPRAISRTWCQKTLAEDALIHLGAATVAIGGLIAPAPTSRATAGATHSSRVDWKDRASEVEAAIQEQQNR